MTHEELLTKIENVILVDKNYLIAVDSIEPKIIDGIEIYWKALNAIIKLHKPLEVDANWCTCDKPYPCPTIDAVVKELQ